MWKGPCVKPCKAYEVRTSNSVSPTIASESQQKIRLENEHENISANGFHNGELPQGFDMVATENPDCRIPSTAESPAGGGLDSQELIVDSPDLSERNNDLILGVSMVFPKPAEPCTSK